MQPKPSFIPFVHVLRAVAALLVLYCHVVGGRAENFEMAYGSGWAPHTLFKAYFLDPLRIRQNFGFLGVALFFVISGFVIAHTAQRETRTSFAIKRSFRILPPLWVAILLALVLGHVEAGMYGPNSVSQMPLSHVIMSLFLVDVFFGVPRGVLDVGWTLSIEAVFYAHALLLLPVLRTRPALAATVLLVWGVAGTWALTLASDASGISTLLRVREMIHYLPLFAIGILAAAQQGGLARPWHVICGAFAGLAAYQYNVLAMKPWALQDAQLFPVQAAYAVAIFFLVAGYGAHLKVPPALSWAGDVSYSLYLVHVPVGFFVAAYVAQHLGATAAIVSGVAASLAVATLFHRWIEIPSQRAGRKLLKPDMTSAAPSPIPAGQTR